MDEWLCVSESQTAAFEYLGTFEVYTPSAVRVHCRSCIQNIPSRGTKMKKSNNKKTEESTSQNMDVVRAPPKNPVLLSQRKADIVPRFLVIKRISNENFDAVNPFAISKSLFGLVGNLKNIKKIKEGLLVETVSEAQAKRLLQIQKLDIYDISVESHRSLNYSKGIVTCPDLLNCSEEEILKEMESEGVINVKRIKKRINGELIDGPSHILTFNKPKLPNKVKAAFYSLEVRPYIPNPIRCYNCQKFGHITTSCKENKVCACGNPPHTGEVCRDPIKCVNCGGPHSAKFRNCPRMIEEVNVQKVRVLENLSYAEARRKVCGPKKPNATYAQITSNQLNVPTFLQELIPTITKVIEDQIQSALSKLKDQQGTPAPKNDYPMPPPSNKSLQRTGIESSGLLEKSSSFSDTSQVSREKRKRSEPNYSVDDSCDSDTSLVSSQLSDSSKKEINKKKKGWPLGKPRKAKDKQTPPSQEPPGQPMSPDGDNFY